MVPKPEQSGKAHFPSINAYEDTVVVTWSQYDYGIESESGVEIFFRIFDGLGTATTDIMPLGEGDGIPQSIFDESGNIAIIYGHSSNYLLKMNLFNQTGDLIKEVEQKDEQFRYIGDAASGNNPYICFNNDSEDNTPPRYNYSLYLGRIDFESLVK
ncbi:hypothetical protein BTA51_28775 [Hahella sp. CCB-MM4]|uniref:hypothetical protein n=1 Tax=Hahella sp. (strain CCB-MM4) TaxID=1926491 RepID=UPI000B9ABF98|nr:hypothetical protein [Hahella sp. CCB-MM4]OZG69908.1 hypothetical protein BTA51_28775 [Hahella sp. CCB-MM4]